MRVTYFYLGVEPVADVLRILSILLVAIFALIMIRPSRGLRLVRALAAQVGPNAARVKLAVLLLLSAMVGTLSQSVSPWVMIAVCLPLLVLFVLPGRAIAGIVPSNPTPTLSELRERGRARLRERPVTRAALAVLTLHPFALGLPVIFGPRALAAPDWAAIIPLPAFAASSLTAMAVGAVFMAGAEPGARLRLLPKVAGPAVVMFGLSIYAVHGALSHTVPWVAAQIGGSVRTDVFTIVGVDPDFDDRTGCGRSLRVAAGPVPATMCRVPYDLMKAATPGLRVATTGKGTWFGQVPATSRLLPPETRRSDI
ncbi:hypothetical protein [Palleronia pelagia]|uniref:Uncharacterized protein n=1 Tax=Palleronia pelagia TaxID=387096 RepID=A0A1H8B8T8_9RHOB|nr:hypothetical protein [Palleronia pelagia]SEM78534.1 hypothetical protein SAMN04488011_101460 [Palleronia pelagia]